MSLTTLLAVIVIGVIGLTVMGYSVDAWINDTVSVFLGNVRDSESSIPAPVAGQVACDLLVNVEWREKGTNIGLGVDAILFLNSDGKTVSYVYDNCYQVGNTQFPTASLLDFMNTKEVVAPLDLIIPAQELFDKEYKLSFILVDSNGLEKKVQHYQDISYVVPALNLEYDFEQNLKFRNVVLDDYTLKIVAENARFWEHTDGEPYLQGIVAP
jgi:hypothetical protein